jgi:hypothetical protein
MRKIVVNASAAALLVYKGSQQVGRSVGETQPGWIAGLHDKAV